MSEYWLDPNGTISRNGTTYSLYWEQFESSTNWTIVELWKSTYIYDTTNSNWNGVTYQGHYVIYEDVVYGTTASAAPNPGTIPPQDPAWFRIYSMSPNTTYNYGTSSVTLLSANNNNIIQMNNRLYWCYDVANYSFGNVNRTLEDGINIYINKKYKNLLVNIYVNDNTLDKLSDVDRDDLYSDIYSKLTAHNFMNAINDLDNKYDQTKDSDLLNVRDEMMALINKLKYLLTLK